MSFFKLSCGSSPSLYREGSEQVDLQLAHLTNHTAVVTELAIYKTLLSGQSLGIYHHLLTVTVGKLFRPGGEPTKGNGMIIKAEKVNIQKADVGRAKAGISVVRIMDVDAEEHYIANSLGVRILMGDLQNILTVHNPHYSFTADNCWKYAYDTFRLLMKRFGDLQPERAGLFHRYLREVPAIVMPGKIIFAGGVGLVGGTVVGGTVSILAAEAIAGLLVGVTPLTWSLPLIAIAAIVGVGVCVTTVLYPIWCPKLLAKLTASWKLVRDYSSKLSKWPADIYRAFTAKVSALAHAWFLSVAQVAVRRVGGGLLELPITRRRRNLLYLQP